MGQISDYRRTSDVFWDRVSPGQQGAPSPRPPLRSPATARVASRGAARSPPRPWAGPPSLEPPAWSDTAVSPPVRAVCRVDSGLLLFSCLICVILCFWYILLPRVLLCYSLFFYHIRYL